MPAHSHLRILIVRLGAMGDILHALPAVTALRTVLPSSWIGWAVEPQWAPLLSASSATEPTIRGPLMPVVDVLHRIPAKQWARSPLSPATWSQVKEIRGALRAQHYDICIDLQGAVRSAWIGRMAAASRMVGESDPRERPARWIFRERVETKGIHVIEQAREVVAAALKEQVGENLPNCATTLPRDADAERWCHDWLQERGMGQGMKPFVLMNPGAGWGAKRWPVDRYAMLAAEFARMGYATVVNVGPGESQLAKAICTHASPLAFAMNGDIGQLIACTRQARLFLGGDTGPLHLAAALKVPVIGIYGPTDPARNGPYETSARVLRHPASRRDHSRKSEPEAGLLAIAVEDVLAEARQLLQERHNSPETRGSV